MNKLTEDVKFKSELLIMLIAYLKDMLLALVNISMMFDEGFEASLDSEIVDPFSCRRKIPKSAQSARSHCLN
jgi:hypothetical protein